MIHKVDSRQQKVFLLPFLFTRRQSEDMSVLALDYPSAPANPSSLAKRDARGCKGVDFMSKKLKIVYLLENALEIIIAFDQAGIISYANAVAEE